MTMLAIDLGGTRLRLAVGHGYGPWTHSATMSRPGSDDATGLISAIRETAAQWAAMQQEWSAIGVSIAGIVANGGTVVRAENLGWTDLPLAEELADAFRLPVQVETDVFCGARYEAQIGAGASHRSMLYVALGTGIGHALVIDGQLWRGASGAANALGHMPVTDTGAECYCGGRDCLCLVAGGHAQAGPNPPPGATDALARALAAAITLVEPEIIVLAGGSLSAPWFDLAGLTASVDARRYPGTRQPNIVVSAVNDGNLRGAALIAEGKP